MELRVWISAKYITTRNAVTSFTSWPVIWQLTATPPTLHCEKKKKNGGVRGAEPASVILSFTTCSTCSERLKLNYFFTKQVLVKITLTFISEDLFKMK